MKRSRARARIALVSVHTSPLDQPGTGDSGGMNVSIREAAARLGERGVAVDVFTRCAGRGVPQVEPLGPLARVIQVQAGPCAPVPKEALPGLLPAFAQGFLGGPGRRPYDLVHAHYWLSGWVGRIARTAWDVPLVASFHTLGRIKNLALADGEAPEPPGRLIGEQAVVRDAERLLVPTRSEAADLARLYRADPGRIRVVTPGVDPARFRPMPKAAARAALGLSGRVAMYVGRLQPHKGPDVAVRALAEAVAMGVRDLSLVLVGGPSGPGRRIEELRALAAATGVGERVRFLPAVPHEHLPGVYAAADVVLVPSRSESFGLVALEAQACGVPVVAAAVGGLRELVADRRSGFLVEGHDPREHARRLAQVLRDPALARRLSRRAVARAARFPWERTADELLSVYEELIPGLGREMEAGAACAR